jgi:6-phosphogluconolactonase
MSKRMVLVVDDAAAVARGGAERFTSLARDAITARGRFAVALSGGSTPKALFQLLAREPFRSAVTWDRVELFWGDERCVPPDHADSNYRMTRESLLDAVPIPAARIHRIEAEQDDHAAVAAAYEAEIVKILGGTAGGTPPAFDLVFLGMGPDGHTASLFPGTTALGERRRWVVANHVPKFKADRITLTYPILNRAARVVFLAAGADKAAVLHEVLEGPPALERLPSQGIRPEVGDLVWLVDRAAAAQLTTSIA